LGSLFLPVNFYAVLDVARIIGIAIIGISLPLLWWRFRHTDREALIGIALVMGVVVLFVPAALPWYYTWPLAVVAALTQSRQAIAVIAGLSTWITVIWKPDGAHGMYSWVHVLLATAAATIAWYSLYQAPISKPRPRAVNKPRPRAVNKPSPEPDEQPRGPDASAARPQDAH
jgi:alpha-1,6-mannosyltransferase